jgi:hypothetical protein
LCSSLANVTIPGSVTTIGAFAFAETSLTNIVIPNGVTNIGVAPFYRCANLQAISVESQQSGLFEHGWCVV